MKSSMIAMAWDNLPSTPQMFPALMYFPLLFLNDGIASNTVRAPYPLLLHWIYSRFQQPQILGLWLNLALIPNHIPWSLIPRSVSYPWPSQISQEPNLAPHFVPSKMPFPSSCSCWHQHPFPQQSVPFKSFFKTPLNTLPFWPWASSWKLHSFEGFLGQN